MIKELETLLKDKKLSQVRPDKNRPEFSYKVKGVFLATMINKKPLVLVFATNENDNNHVVVEYRTGTLCSKVYKTLPGLKNDTDNILKALDEQYRNYPRVLGVNNVEELLVSLVDQCVIRYGVINTLPVEVITLLQSHEGIIRYNVPAPKEVKPQPITITDTSDDFEGMF